MTGKEPALGRLRSGSSRFSHTQQEIADALGVGQSALAQMEHFVKIGQMSEFDKTDENLDFLSKEQIASSDH